MIQAAVRLLPPPPTAPHLRGIVYPGLSTLSSSAVPSGPFPLSQPTDPSRSGYFAAKQLWGVPRPPAAAGTGGSGGPSGFASSFGMFGSAGGGTLPSPLPGQTPPPAGSGGLPTAGGAGKTKGELAVGGRPGWAGGEQGSKKEDGPAKKDELPPVTWGLPKQFFREEVTVVGPGGERTKVCSRSLCSKSFSLCGCLHRVSIVWRRTRCVLCQSTRKLTGPFSSCQRPLSTPDSLSVARCSLRTRVHAAWTRLCAA